MLKKNFAKNRSSRSQFRKNKIVLLKKVGQIQKKNKIVLLEIQ